MTIRASVRASSPVVRAMLVSGVAILVAALPLSLTSPLFYDKSAAFVLALALGLAHASLSGQIEHCCAPFGRHDVEAPDDG